MANFLVPHNLEYLNLQDLGLLKTSISCNYTLLNKNEKNEINLLI